jgi:DNA processing protein
MRGVDNDEKYFVAFSLVPGIGPARLKLLIDYFGSAKSAWEAGEAVINQVGLPKDALTEFINVRQKLNLDQYIANLEKRGVKILTFNNKFYPKHLKIIPNPPNVLYLKTNLSTEEFFNLASGKNLGVVGTRKITTYGKEITANLVAGLVSAGFVITSGLALGVDGMAHQTTIDCNGKTIAVLGAGVEVVYPREHADLYRKIIATGGAIISEVAPEKFVAKGIFPARNRIISGLSQALLVTEGAIDSGSLITARAALDQGREVFAVPGPINSPMAEGTNYLLKQGAKLVTRVEDILEEMGVTNKASNSARLPDGQVTQLPNKNLPKGETPQEQKILDLLYHENLEFDDLVVKTGFEAGQLISILTNLELNKKVQVNGLVYGL